MAKKATKKSILPTNESLRLRAEIGLLKQEVEQLTTAAIRQTTRISSLEEANAMLSDTVNDQLQEIKQHRKDNAAAIEAGGNVVTELRNAMSTIGDLAAAVLNLSSKG
jgi:hypothetical protein